MPFKLTTQQIDQQAALAQVLEDRAADLSAAIERFNQSLGPLWPAVAEAVSNYNEAVQETRSFVGQVQIVQRNAWIAKSQRWQDSAAGSKVLDWIERWEAIGCETLDLDQPSIDIKDLDLDLEAELVELPKAAGSA